MTDLRKAAEMALEFIVLVATKDKPWFTEKEFEVVAALRQALAQPKWVGLNEDDFHGMSEREIFIAHVVEAKLKEKNT